jgi:hypothetical protein
MNCLAMVRFVIELDTNICGVDNNGDTTLLAGACCGRYSTMQFMLEEAGANMETSIPSARMYGRSLLSTLKSSRNTMRRVMELRGTPLDALVALLSPEPARVVREGARLWARLPVYLVRWRAVLDVHCPVLLPPLRTLVNGYRELATTKEIWAARLGACLYVYEGPMMRILCLRFTSPRGVWRRFRSL